MVRRTRGAAYSETLLEGENCLWLGYHTNASDYSHVPLSNSYFLKRASNGHIGTIVYAGMFGAEVKFSVDDEETHTIKLCLSVSELLPLTVQEAKELTEYIDGGKAIVSTKTQIKESLHKCSEKGCSFTSTSPQGLGTHRVKTHNLLPRKRGNIRKVAISSTNREAATRSGITSDSTTPINWKSRHDAMSKRYARLSTKYDELVKTVQKIAVQYTRVTTS
jgi:hypothetical protein|tara:strand:+ start:8329 stop:8988 length:660 start_codon:yes stop_codon:yes gene_type:complete